MSLKNRWLYSDSQAFQVRLPIAAVGTCAGADYLMAGLSLSASAALNEMKGLRRSRPSPPP